MALRHVFLGGQRTTFAHDGRQQADVAGGHVGQNGIAEPRQIDLVFDVFFGDELFQMGGVFVAAPTEQHHAQRFFAQACDSFDEHVETFFGV